MPADEMLTAALTYARSGWPVFPCDRNKRPLIPSVKKGEGGVYDATTDPEKIVRMWSDYPRANIGCHVGEAGMMVLDLDRYKPGFDLGEVERTFEGLPETHLRQFTPRGGEHLFYALAEGERVSPSVAKVADGVDIRSSGSYVLLAPSETEDGRYTWAHETVWPTAPEPPKPAFRTDRMVKLAGTPAVRSKNKDVWIIAPDLPENIDAAIRWLRDTARPAIEGKGGDKDTYEAAAMLRSFGLSEATAAELLSEVYNPRCVPPWEPDDIQSKVENAYRYATSAPGNMTTAYKDALVKMLFKPVRTATASGRELTAGRYRIVDREGVECVADPVWLIPEVIEEGGYAMLVGAPHTFKTFVALDMMMTVACPSAAGERAWGNPTKHGPVLLIAGEGRSGIKLRIKAWETRHNAGKPVMDLYMADPVPLVSAGEAEWEGFCDLAHTMSPDGYAMVVIDTAGKAMAGLNINATENASLLTRLVQMMQARFGAAVMVIIHTGHGDQTRAAGSGVFQADPDTILVLSREGKSREIEVTMTKQKNAPEWNEPRPLKLDDAGQSLVVVRGTPKPEAPKKVDTIATSAQTLDHIVAMTLKANELKAWNSKDLAETLAHREDIDVPSPRLLTMLKSLREQTGTCANRAYDPGTRRWRWRG